MGTSIEPAMKTQSTEGSVAYFCMEYGLDASLPIYSGGLGVLAGDILKAAHDAGRNLLGIGVMWDEGYCVQCTTPEGLVENTWVKTPRNSLLPLEVEVSVAIEGEDVSLRAFEVHGFGNARLLLLEPKSPKHQHLTRRLYAGNSKMRIAQELILGVGGIRLLRALGLSTETYHFNEGHALFAGFELIREKMALGLTYQQSLQSSRNEIVFTTHTPVKAGNEVHCVETLLESGVGLGIMGKKELEDLGGSPFEMTVAALRMSRKANAVAQLHGRTASQMWAHVESSAPIIPITNGIHLSTWQDERMREWRKHSPDTNTLASISNVMKRELLAFIDSRTGPTLSEDRLLIGFARRAATYKRADLILEDIAWLEPHLHSGRIQIVFSGKAHPEDMQGRAMIERVTRVARAYPESIVFLDNYDMHVGRMMTRGVDVWLNNPRRPNEASGTSGMKAASNGVLNLSVLDGWWDEGCRHGENGWQFGDAYQGEQQDTHDGHALRMALSDYVLPTYYDKPDLWVAMQQAAIETACHRFSAKSMVDTYYEKLYR